MTGWMNLLWIILLPLVLGDAPCCKRKNVGGLGYSLSRKGPTEEYNCLDHCIYSKDDDPGQDYCFKSGILPTECEDCMRTRKNLTSVLKSAQETSDLLHALIEAKKSGSYSGPKIYGQSLNIAKSEYFNSSYDAAASYHGYPGLCPGIPFNTPEAETGYCCKHGDPRFLPWHRLFMVQLEDALRSNKKYQHVTLPYWDWTQDFTELPLVRDPFITDPITNETLENPFYHSWIPGSPQQGNPQPLYTKRNARALIDYNHQEHPKFPNHPKFPKQTLLGELVLLALEEPTYEGFEGQIEYPHNIVHSQLDQFNYPYTMQNLYYASFDPIFLIFHTMVDFQWAIFEALQKHRKPHEHHYPQFGKQLPPFNTDYNDNSATKRHSIGYDTIDYRKAFNYCYDDLTLFGMSIPELYTFLNKPKNNDRLFAGFSLPSMQISRITFNICHPITNCTFSSPNFQISKVHGNLKGVYTNSILLYLEVTKYLPQFGLNASQDIGFKIVSSSIPKNVTFTPVSIFRNAQSNKDRITVHWREDQDEYNYVPFFKVRQNSNTSLRFLLENGSMSAYQYPSREEFQICSNNRTLVDTEIEITEEEIYYFQNPQKLDCKEEDKLEVHTNKPTPWGGLVREKNGSAFIGWQINMTRFSKGICMKPGTYLTFHWRRGYHNIVQLTNETDFENCTKFPPSHPGYIAPHSQTFPPPSQGGFNAGVYYIVCTIGDHCHRGMKLKINVIENCDD